jgi:hypothetical protein
MTGRWFWINRIDENMQNKINILLQNNQLQQEFGL